MLGLQNAQPPEQRGHKSMVAHKKAARVVAYPAASKSLNARHFTQFSHHVKAAIYKLAPWLFFVGVLHG